MGIIRRKPVVGKYYMLGSSMILVKDVTTETYSYSYIDHFEFSSDSTFTWNITMFNEIEVTELLAALL